MTRFDRERGRDPGLYYLRVFGEPGGAAPWGWRFGGHHVSLNNLVVDGALVATTPCFLGADPATSPLLGGAVQRPLGAGRGPGPRAGPVVAARAREPGGAAAPRPVGPGHGQPHALAEGDRVIPLAGVWRAPFPDAAEQAKLQELSDAIDDAAGYDDADHSTLAYTAAPKGVPAAEFDAGQRELLRALLDTYLGRVPAEVSPVAPLRRRRRAGRRPPRLGRPDRARCRRTTTACRARGCCSSGTTPSAGRTTRTRCGATRRRTSGWTCSPSTAPRTTADVGEPVRVVVVDDHAIVRDGLAAPAHRAASDQWWSARSDTSDRPHRSVEPTSSSRRAGSPPTPRLLEHGVEAPTPRWNGSSSDRATLAHSSPPPHTGPSMGANDVRWVRG